jgi:adenylate cyclase
MAGEREVSEPGQGLPPMAEDGEEARLRRSLAILACGLMIFAAGLWMVIYSALRIRFEIMVPLGFQLVSAVSLIAYLRSGNFERFRLVQVTLYLFVPFALQWSMGNFVTASAVMLWALLAPIGVMVLEGPRQSLPWFVAYMALTALSGFFDWFITQETGIGVPLHVVAVFFVLNFAAVSTVVYLLVGYFARERERLGLQLRLANARLTEEQERSERLLLNVLPGRVAERLKRQDTVADSHPEVTVLFADIVGFTPVAERLPPAQVIAMLGELFSAFDEAAQDLGVEKIKTLGDGYMAAGGLAGSAPACAGVAALALRMHAIAARCRTPAGEPIAVHVGLATGPVSAGVIGRTKFAYDLWGSTVNVASRLCDLAAPGEVLIDAATRDRLAADWVCEGPVNRVAKGLGELRAWQLAAPRRAPPAGDVQRAAISASSE